MQQFGEFILNHWILWSLFIALSGLMVWSLVVGATSGIKQLNATEFTRYINREKAIVVDVREGDAFKKGHILNARNIPATKMDERADELEAQRKGPTLLYCHSGNSALSAAKVLQKKGYEQVYSLKGGVMAWQEAKLPLSTD